MGGTRKHYNHAQPCELSPGHLHSHAPTRISSSAVSVTITTIIRHSTFNVIIASFAILILRIRIITMFITVIISRSQRSLRTTRQKPFAGTLAPAMQVSICRITSWNRVCKGLCAYVHAYMHACVHTSIRAYVHTHIHTHTSTETLTCKHATIQKKNIHTDIQPCRNTSIHPSHTYRQTNIHKNIHAYVHIHIPI